MFTLDRKLTIDHSAYCPYCSFETDRCQAALSQLRHTQSPHTSLCSSEDHDSCPLFLSKLLRA